jgi:acyl-CoA reductase-like NAD-dependent aldehyde dehydrogenase
VHQDVYDTFIDQFVNQIKNSSIAYPLARSQHVHFLNEQIQDALDKGAKILIGGKSDESSFFPTVLVDVDHTMKLMKNETFGPLIGVQKVANDEEALSLMNDTTYGLTASVYSKNIESAKKILEKLDVGTGYINCCDRVSPYLPWSGRRDSGLGTTLSFHGILSFVKPKGFHIRQNL